MSGVVRTVACMAASKPLPDDYPQLLERLKREIGAARTRAALAVNEELIRLYWRIGKEILERQQRDGWGAKVIDRLSADLRQQFPGMAGLFRTNLHYMRQFAACGPDRQIVPQAVGQLRWGHVRCLLDKAPESDDVRRWYARRAVEEAWSRRLLVFSNRYVVIELKLGKFRPQYTGQINFFVNIRRSAASRAARRDDRGTEDPRATSVFVQAGVKRQ